MMTFLISHMDWVILIAEGIMIVSLCMLLREVMHYYTAWSKDFQRVLALILGTLGASMIVQYVTSPPIRHEGAPIGALMIWATLCTGVWIAVRSGNRERDRTGRSGG